MPQSKGDFAKHLLLLGLGVSGMLAGYRLPYDSVGPIFFLLGFYIVFTVVQTLLNEDGE